MKIEMYDNKKLIYTSENEKEVISNLCYYLYSKAINKNKNITIKNNYNYSNIQTIRVLEHINGLNKREIVISGIPTSWGSLDTCKFMEKLEVIK